MFSCFGVRYRGIFLQVALYFDEPMRQVKLQIAISCKDLPKIAKFLFLFLPGPIKQKCFLLLIAFFIKIVVSFRSRGFTGFKNDD